MQHIEICLKHVKCFMEHTKCGVKTTIESSNEGTIPEV